jgi:cation:H+ antiporter
MMIVAASVILALGFAGIVSIWTGVLMFGTLVGYLGWVTYTDRGKTDGSDSDLSIRLAGWKEALFIVGGLAGLFFGADLLVKAATSIAREFGISEAVIGLTIVAVGTSLPELATSVVAAFRRQAEMALGNVVGSNIFNILGILGITAIIVPVPVDPTMAGFDIPFMTGVSIAFAALILFAGRVGRIAGGAMLVAYTGYVVWLF